MKLFIINGFLGSGKTTFLKNIIQQFQSHRLAVIVNEYGNESIDSISFRSLNLMVNEINNGSIFCSCKSSQFLDELMKLHEQKIEYVFVESSGLSDPYSLGGILTLFQEKIEEELEQIKVITIVDAAILHKIIHTLQLVERQIIVSDIIIMNKIDIASQAFIENATTIARTLNPFAKIIQTSYGKIKKSEISYHRLSTTDLPAQFVTKNLLLDSTTIYFEANDADQLYWFLKELNDKAYRIKGFFNKEYQINSSYNEDVTFTKGNYDVDNYVVFLFNKELLTESIILNKCEEHHIKIKELH